MWYNLFPLFPASLSRMVSPLYSWMWHLCPKAEIYMCYLLSGRSILAKTAAKQHTFTKNRKCIWLSLKCLNFTLFMTLVRLLRRLKKLAKLKILEWCTLWVRKGKSGPLERVQLGNQIQGLRLPDGWEAVEKKKKGHYSDNSSSNKQ